MIYALIVIYNRKCDDSISLKSVLKHQDAIHPIVFDNSDRDYNNKEFCSINGIEYISRHTNIGISKAYNYVIDNHKFNNDDYLMVLDDDTCLTDEYFYKIFDLTKYKKYDAILPIVISNERILSPSRLYLTCLSHPSSKPKDIDCKQLTAINSGMVIKCSVYNEIKYNEKLFLDFVDHDFIRKLKSINANIIVANCKIYQRYSNDEKSTLSSAINRFNIYVKDFHVYCCECNKESIFRLYIFKHALQLALRYHTLIFLKIALENNGKI